MSQSIAASSQTVHIRGYEKTQVAKGSKTTKPHKIRTNKSAGVILIDPWSSSNIYDPSTYRLMVVQQRNSGAWGLPKGHLEQEEALLPAAHRELMEETGVQMEDLVEGEDYMPLLLPCSHPPEKHSGEAPPANNHVQIKKIHFFVYILMRRGSSLIQRPYDEHEISAVSWMNIHDWFVDAPISYVSKPQPPRYNRTLSDTSVNLLMDICALASAQLQVKYGGGGRVMPPYSVPCVNLF